MGLVRILLINVKIIGFSLVMDSDQIYIFISIPSFYSVSLSLNLLNFLNGITRLPFMALYIRIFRDIKIKTWSWSVHQPTVKQSNTILTTFIYLSNKADNSYIQYREHKYDLYIRVVPYLLWQRFQNHGWTFPHFLFKVYILKSKFLP